MFFIVSAIDAKLLLKLFAISCGLVIVSPLSRERTVRTMKATVFRELRNLIPFCVVVNAIPIDFKIFIIGLFTFFYKGEE